MRPVLFAVEDGSWLPLRQLSLFSMVFDDAFLVGGFCSAKDVEISSFWPWISLGVICGMGYSVV
jgi:hypothetical protein